MGEKFEVEVLSRLAVIESKLDDYNSTRDMANEANNRSKENEKRLTQIEDNNKWLRRTVVGAVIASMVGIVCSVIQLGVGVH